MGATTGEFIVVEGARQNNLKGINLQLPLGELVVVTGVSGSGKSSLAFDTIYAEGQRRYVETFSPYARQFLDRMDKPKADRIDGIPPAIAIDQTNPVKTSRSTVGTMTELNDHLKLLFARAAQLFCRNCGKPVRRDTPDSIYEQLKTEMSAVRGSPEPSVMRGSPDPAQSVTKGLPIIITFPVPIPKNFTEAEIRELLAKQGYHKIDKRGDSLEVIQDSVLSTDKNRARIIEALEAALKHGQGRVAVNGQKFSSDLHCAECDIHYRDPVPSLFSFNSPIGACETCRGFGRTIGIDYDLVVPDDTKSLADGAVRPWQTESYSECQDDLIKYARKTAIPIHTPWRELAEAQRRWVIDGIGPWEDQVWYGVKRFFAWLETKSYKMHIRVLLSKYRTYVPCNACGGARLKPDALLWKVNGQTIHDVMLLPIDRCHEFFTELKLPAPLDEADDLLLAEIRTRLRYLVDVGLGYLTLDRQSRTLSGGEVQRVNLTTALGTSLVNTLYVLDEPSIGLHPRDINRLIGILHRLRAAGNTLLVVEHDPDVIRAADRILDLGPGPGERGGEIVFFGTQAELQTCEGSLTAQYLTGQKHVSADVTRRTVSPKTPRLRILGAREHNLKNIDTEIPLNRLVCVTGVSGSGKSTLIQDVLYNALCKLKHKPDQPAGRHRSIAGHEQIEDVVMVDQSPIGRTTRSNPASYVGAFDAIRKLFAAAPLAKERSYTTGTFSFNSGEGRCPTCGGNGFEHVEMQFLSDVYIRCPDCDGRRYRSVVLEVKINGKSIADVLEMTVNEACEFFAGQSEVLSALAPLREVGLGYMKLGQPVPTLSGGEAQRLKLAAHLTQTTAKRTLFLFDEPTTGLHFDDIAKLLHAFHQLIDRGHSVIVIEHNLDVIRAADWIIDLGPEGGDAGGEVVCVGAPDDVAQHQTSHTGAALRGLAKPQVVAESPGPGYAVGPNHSIRIHNAREHNLKNIDVRVPRDKFTVITGISGSGKSTLAFDILFAEGQRRYLESLNAYARQFVQPASRPDVDAIFGIPPTVAIEQRTSRGGRKSTVATVTEVYHFLRLLFVKLGTQHCPDCEIPIQSQTREMILAKLMNDYRGQRVGLLAPLIVARKGYYTDLAEWALRKGFALLRVDGEFLPTANWPRLDRFKEHNIELPVGSCEVVPKRETQLGELLDVALEFGKGNVLVKNRIFSIRRACPKCSRSFEELDPRLFSFNSKHGWCPRCYGTGLLLFGFNEEHTGEEIWWNEWFEGQERPCPACHGQRIRPEALAVRFQGMNIAQMTRWSVTEAEKHFREAKFRGREAEIARDIVAELQSRLRFLDQVGLSYLSLDRAAPTLSGGEAQRIRLASQLGSNLRGVCYILDEPTIGLHPRDNRMLLDTLHELEAKGNTVVVVEHDEDTIRRAEHIIDLGPGAGSNGGRLVAEGTIKDIVRSKESLTGKLLREPLQHPIHKTPRNASTKSIEIIGANLHNLKDVRVKIPLRRLVCVSGVSGSGKSTLVRNVLHENLKTLTGRSYVKFHPKVTLKGCAEIRGFENVARVLEVDQTPIGKTPRSCPATYVGFWDDIRQLFANTPEAKMRGYGPSRFSFNVASGRCPECEGQGLKKIEMSFLPDVSVTCDACRGKRFTTETLDVRFKDKSIGDVLAMSVDEAVEFFAAHRHIHHSLKLLQEVGLGYLTLGQQSPTLSGGEAQRIKLVTELAKAKGDESDVVRKKSGALYVLDEPTIGLHMADVEKLIRVLHRLVDAGNSVVIIEHNLDVIAEADWIIDLGPEGGDAGGKIVAKGPPQQVIKAKSHTAVFLGEFLKERLVS
ncbi:MAG TPA: excinuclease ABC subunit UvrA [Verrucomicrobiae bacterium]|nr:excinuclease ABC subunit UvrA [Verrucomicrobiae bacterium]